MNERELLAQKALVLDDAKALNDLAEKENRDFSADEQKAYDAKLAKAAELDKRIERAHAMPMGTPERPAPAPAFIPKLGDNFTRAMGAYLRTGDVGGVRHLMNSENQVEIRASNATDMNIGTAADGGVLVPTGFYNQIIAKRSEMNLADKLGLKKIPGVGTTVDVPYDNEADGEFVSTGEGSGFDLDAPALAKKSLTLVKYSKYIKLSVELLADEDANLEAFLTDWIARGQAKTMNSLLLTEVATNGTSLKTTASATAIAAGEPEGVVFNATVSDYLDDSPSVAWAMKPSTFGAIASITGSPRLYAETPSGSFKRTLLGYPVEYTSKAGAMTAGLKSAYFGNWNYVGWREAPGFTILRDPYSAATTGQVVLWMYFRTVFGVLQPDAVGYLIMHT